MGDSLCRLRQFAFVEPIPLVFCHWIALLFVVMSQYMYLRFSEDVGFPYRNLTSSGSGCNEEQFGGNSTLKELEIEVQARSANFLTLYTIFGSLSSIIVSPFMGSYSDKKGRKAVLVAPLIGAFLETTLLLVLVHMKLNLYVAIAGGILNGLTGSYTTLWLSLMSYLSDTVEKDKLSLRIAILGFFILLAATASQLTSGLWIENLGFTPPIWFLWGILLLVILYTVFFLKESLHTKKDVKVAFFSMESLKRTFRVFTKQRAGGRKNLMILIILFSISFFLGAGTGAVQLLYLLRSPLCWSPSILGYWLAYRFSSLGLGSVAGVGILKKCFSEINIAIIGFASQIAGMLLMAFSDKTWMVFLVPLASILSAAVDPILSSLSSRLVTSEEQGVLFALIGIISSVGGLVGTALFNTLYPLSLRFNFPGFVFVCAAGITLGQILMIRRIDIPLDVLNQKETTKENKLMDEKPADRQDQTEYTTSL